ncbi:DUF4124 domain-containing protein [Neisseria weaveri]|uniref:DUF4124 domain-containing protein n=1 Tax=Neisseria weaveri TaxID=28091 RepID=A0A448VJ19_9NEIS|nr:DUF4124 domain-containing protein [Neisseria weaveri]EGV35310.1 hypothetical protein l13_17280 [Neisseria weaveri ATCC 51223]EGV37052.1 hypothetical protein l11_14130 [Neisseria weaveri LMG 5135]SAY51140.1 Uncharacterised protein [Neisseria weaveri]VEJ49760.1 Uncharacterised protein [Neisseria weaveri]
MKHINWVVWGLVGGLSLSVLPAKGVFTWDEKGKTTYSDEPWNLQPSRTGTVNVRTHRVTASQSDTSGSQDEAQKAALMSKQAEELSRLHREEDCKTAKMNRQFAEFARSENKVELVRRYNNDIKKFCD